MKLKVHDVLVCENFGTPIENCESETIILALIAQGRTREEAQVHLDNAIFAGAYIPEAYAPATYAKTEKQDRAQARSQGE